MKYRKKPVVVEAVRWIANDISTSQVQEFLGRMENMDGDVNGQRFYRSTLIDDDGERVWANDPSDHGRLWVEANHAWLEIENGEWIIRDARGAYPCKPEIFATTYEPVEETAA